LSSPKLQWLEVMRGLAALWVLLHHADQSISHFVGSPGANPLISNGYLGVDFFFVLSGFIIAYSSRRLAESGRGVADYLQARVLRIYIPYLPIGLGMYCLYMLLPEMSHSDRSPGLLTSLTLLPTNSPPALSVAWTLVHEIIFYAIFAAWFAARRLFWVGVAAWAVAITWVYFTGLSLERYQTYFFSPLNLCFILGMCIFLLTGRLAINGRVAAAITLIGLLAVALQAIDESPNRLVIALGFGLLVLAAASSTAMSRSAPASLLTLGAASYAIYLVHNPVLSIAVRGVAVISPGIPPWLGLAVISFVALGAGLFYWRAYEGRALRLARLWIQRSVRSERAIESIRK